MFIFGGCYTSNERYNDTFYLKLRNSFFIQPPSNGINLPIKNPKDLPKTQWAKSVDQNQELTTQWHTTKTKLSFSEDTEELTIKEHPSTISMNLTSIPSNGENPKQKEIPQNQEEVTLPLFLPKKIKCSSSEDGTSSVNSTTSLSTILKLKHGTIHKSIIKSQNGTWMVYSLPASPHGNTSSSVAPQEISLKEVTEQVPNLKTPFTISISITWIGSMLNLKKIKKSNHYQDNPQELSTMLMNKNSMSLEDGLDNGLTISGCFPSDPSLDLLMLSNQSNPKSDLWQEKQNFQYTEQDSRKLMVKSQSDSSEEKHLSIQLVSSKMKI